MQRICFIGFGEAGQAMAAGLREEGVGAIAAWDILFPEPAGAPLRAAAEKIGVRAAASAADAVAEADIVISAVTAASSSAAAQSVAPHIAGNPCYLDVNSVSPGRKQADEKLLAGRARYVDAAILSPIHPARHKSPMLIAGPHADDIAPLLTSLGMAIAVAGPQTGAAAAIKMIRSVMIKGIEALTLECFLAASRAGVAEAVADSLKNNYPGVDWTGMSEYNVERMISHGLRRAAEMEEVAATLRELGVVPTMTEATVARQRELGALGRQQQIRDSIRHGRQAMLIAIGAATRECK